MFLRSFFKHKDSEAKDEPLSLKKSKKIFKRRFFLRDEDIELNLFLVTIFYHNAGLLNKLRELDQQIIQYNRLKKSFNEFRLSQLNQIIFNINTLKKKVYIPEAISSLEATKTDIRELLGVLNLVKAQCQKIIQSQFQNLPQKVNLIHTKSIHETLKMENLKKDIDKLNCDLKLKIKTFEYQVELAEKEKQNEIIMDKMIKIINYVIQNHFDRFNGYAKSTYINDAYLHWLEQLENKELSGSNYDIQHVIYAFKVFLICCLQNKESDNFFGGLFKNPRTRTGTRILQYYKYDLISILYEGDQTISLDYNKLANDLFKNEKACIEARSLMDKAMGRASDNNNKMTKLTIQEWTGSSNRFRK